VVGRVRVGLVMVLLGVVGLLVGWRIERNSGDATVLAVVAALAVLSALALAAGCLLTASAGGEVPVRVTGGLLFVAGLVVVVTQHEVWWWLPNSWETPVSLAALAISLAGLGVLLLAYGFSLAGLSGAFGLLALTCLALTLLPYIGSEERSVLRAFATSLGAVALTTGVRVATTQRTRGDLRAMTAIAGAVGAAVTVYAGYDSYDMYAPGKYHAAVIGAAITGAVASLSLGVASSWPSGSGGLPRQDPNTGPAAWPETVVPLTTPMAEQAHEPLSNVAPPEPPPQAPAQRTPPLAPADPVTTPPAPTVVAAKPSSTTAASAAPAAETTPPARDRLQTASLAVGLTIGLITIAKELIAAALAIIL
jgi:hypothetical protein